MSKYYDNNTFFSKKLVLEKFKRKNFIRSKSFIRIKSPSNTNNDDDSYYSKDKSSYTSLALACMNSFYPAPAQQLVSPSQTRISQCNNRTQGSIKADRQIKEYFYHCITNIDYPMRVNYCWNFSTNHEKLFKNTIAKRKLAKTASTVNATHVASDDYYNCVSGTKSSCLSCVSEKKITKVTKNTHVKSQTGAKTPKSLFKANSHLSAMKV